jgi:hypothetical protein
MLKTIAVGAVASCLLAGSACGQIAASSNDHKVVLFSVDGGKIAKVSEAPIGAWSQGAAFSRDGKTVVVQNMVQHNLMVFRNDGGELSNTGQAIDEVGGPAAIRA